MSPFPLQSVFAFVRNNKKVLGLETIDIIKYLSIPVVAGFVGWITNWIAVKAMFYPLEFIGIPPLLGWQGIVPSKARKMAGISVDTSLATIGSVSEVAKEIDMTLVAQHAIKVVEPDVEHYIDEAMREEKPVLWANLPDAMKKQVVERTREELPGIIEAVMAEVEERIETLLDLKGMIQEHLSTNKELLIRIFLEVGAKEFKFIVNSGFYFGALFGVIQMVVWYFYPEWWILPFFGLLVGYATNVIALKIIFQPLNPVKIGPFTLQGLFLKRQHEVSDTYSAIVTDEILTIRNMIAEMLNGPKKEQTRAIISKHFRRIVDETAGMRKPFVQSTLGPTSFANLKEKASETALKMADSAFDDPAFNKDRSLAIQAIMKTRMRQLSPEGFQNMLRPAFQEDEWKLILAGGILGLIAGVCQLVFIFS